jgi:hypothetical protein
VARFTVMTWNVENLFDLGDEDAPATQAELKAKIESLSAVVDEQKPHVPGLQEIGSESALGSCRRRSRRRCRTARSHHLLPVGWT